MLGLTGREGDVLVPREAWVPAPALGREGPRLDGPCSEAGPVAALSEASGSAGARLAATPPGGATGGATGGVTGGATGAWEGFLASGGRGGGVRSSDDAAPADPADEAVDAAARLPAPTGRAGDGRPGDGPSAMRTRRCGDGDGWSAAAGSPDDGRIGISTMTWSGPPG